MPEWTFRKIRMVVEFDVDGSMSDGTAVDVATSSIRNIREATIVPDGEKYAQLYVKPPRIISTTVERR